MSEPRPLLMVPYPLRPDFVATVEIPRNMTPQEADRLAKMVLALADGRLRDS